MQGFFISPEGKRSSKPTLHKAVILTLLLWGRRVGGDDNAAPVTAVVKGARHAGVQTTRTHTECDPLQS